MVNLVVSGDPAGTKSTVYGLDGLRQAGTETYRNLVAALNVHVYQDGAVKVPSSLDNYSMMLSPDTGTPLAVTMTKKGPLQVLNEARRSGFSVVAMSSHIKPDGTTEVLWTLESAAGGQMQ